MRILTTAIVGLSVLTATSAADFVWVEGEDAVERTTQRHGWYDSVTKDSFSGGDWLSNYGGGDPAEAKFEFEVPKDGEYFFWVRANSVAGPKLSYKLGDGTWKEVDFHNAIENLNIAADGKPDMRFISWNNAGKVSLKRGPGTIRFKFHGGNNNHGGLDCFVFSSNPFFPRGALRPGARTGKANAGYFAWEPTVDEFTSVVVDISFLNEDIAGQSGRVQARGNDFVLGDGKKVRFWAANAGPGISGLDHQSHIYLAKHLAKRGVNLVRLHGGIYSADDPKVDMQRLDNLHHVVWAMKQEGIYTKLSFYFPAWFRLDRWHREGGRWPVMLLFFDDDMQKVYFSWADALLNTNNPYTNIPMGKDPAVAMVEIQNEDSHFFWTFGKDRSPPQRWEKLKKIHGDWLKKRYGSISNAVAAWDGARIDGDNPAGGKMELYGAWNMTTDGFAANPRIQKRISDQVRFLTENMRDFYVQAIDYFRDQCGYEGLVSCGNWHTADARTLDALERYCYTAGHVIDHHGYFDHNHEGATSSYSVRPGHTFKSQSALYLKHANPLPYVETDGYPHIVSEIGWPMPNMYRAEGAYLTAAYGSLWGLDSVINFAVGSASWDQSVGKFPLSNPVALGSYPAAALIYRNEYVRESPPVVVETLQLEDLYAVKGTKAYVRPALDQFRAAQRPGSVEKTGEIKGAIDPMSFYVGRVVRSFEGNPEESKITNLKRYINRRNKTIKSITEELHWDYGSAVATMNTPKAQAAAGFLGKAVPIELANVTIDMKNDYGTVMVVAMDDKPLAESAKILVQCMTIDQFYGWRSSQPDGMGGTIESVGSAPWGVQKFDVSVTLKLQGSKPAKVIACDENGYPTDKTVKTSGDASSFKVDIDESTAYTVIQR